MKEMWFPGYKKKKWRCLSWYIPLGIKNMPTYWEWLSLHILFYSGCHTGQSVAFYEHSVLSSMPVVTHCAQGTAVDSVKQTRVTDWFLPSGSLWTSGERCPILGGDDKVCQNREQLQLRGSRHTEREKGHLTWTFTVVRLININTCF